MDKMLQIKILQADTRLLFVPVALDELVIDPIKHLEAVTHQSLLDEDNSDSENQNSVLMPVYADLETNIIR